MHEQHEASAAKWLKTRIRRNMKMDLLNSVLIISINDLPLENKVQVIKIVVEAVRKYE